MELKNENILNNKKKYVPPHKLNEFYLSLQSETNKQNEDYQKIMWNLTKKSINGIINKLNFSNITEIAYELFNENLFRAKGLLANSIIKSQIYCPLYSNVFCSLISIINSKFPDIVRIIINRYIKLFQNEYRKKNVLLLDSILRLFAHMINQSIISSIMIYEIYTLFMNDKTDSSIELLCSFLIECGVKLEEETFCSEIYENLRCILHEKKMSKLSLYSIETLFLNRRNNNFRNRNEEYNLNLINEEDIITHKISIFEDIPCSINGGIGTEDDIDLFKYDENFEENEKKWDEIKLELLGCNDNYEEKKSLLEKEIFELEDYEKDNNLKIIDLTETEIINLRKTIYLTITSSLDFQECCHKLLKMNFREGEEFEIVNMIIECCIQERNYERFYGLLTERLCSLNNIYKNTLEKCFELFYIKIHKYETIKIKHLACLFSHLLYTKSISWIVMTCIRLTEETTTSSGRIFIKDIFLELSRLYGVEKFSNIILNNKSIFPYITGIFIKEESQKETRFCINFFTFIGLGPLTEDMRKYLENICSKEENLIENTSINKNIKSSDIQNNREENCDEIGIVSSHSNSSSSRTVNLNEDNLFQRRKRKLSYKSNSSDSSDRTLLL